MNDFKIFWYNIFRGSFLASFLLHYLTVYKAFIAAIVLILLWELLQAIYYSIPRLKDIVEYFDFRDAVFSTFGVIAGVFISKNLIAGLIVYAIFVIWSLYHKE